MSAEEELFSLACQDMPVSPDEIRAAMRAWASELADRVRDVDSWPEAKNYAQGTMYTYRSFARRCAAQIDPEINTYLRSKGVQHVLEHGMLDRFAHNLAEAIRENCQKVTCGPTEEQCACGEQADLIDPEAR
jgi:hypothetical protein